MKFIKINCIHPSNIECDTVLHVRQDRIVELCVASSIDRRQRNEIKTLVVMENGVQIGTSATAAEILDKLSEVV